jgi:hypothetical protein
MSVHTFSVDRYEVRLGDALTATWGGLQVRARAVIACHGEDHRFLIYFLREDSVVPNPVYTPAAKVGAIFVPYFMLAAFVDLLRHEKPIFAYLNADNPQWNSIRTTLEPVGEAE